jgi:ATP-dependent Lhr-like helicase
VRAAFGVVRTEPELVVPAAYAREWTREAAIEELLRGRLEIVGPVTVEELSRSTGWSEPDVDAALLALESRGLVLRGYFTPGTRVREWCDRRLLARIHRYTLSRLRAEIQPVTASDLVRFLFRWQRVERDARVSGLEGLASVLEVLDGYQAAAGAWEAAILPARCKDYQPELLDMLCLTGRLAWDGWTAGPRARRAVGRCAPRPSRYSSAPPRSVGYSSLGVARSRPTATHRVCSTLWSAEAPRSSTSWWPRPRLPAAHVERALGELAGAGRVTADSFAGLRALVAARPDGPSLSVTRLRRASVRGSVETAGRWSLLEAPAEGVRDDETTEGYARTLLRRYGVVFRRLSAYDGDLVPWRDLVRVYRRLEARGEIRGGRFVAGFSGEQFALPEAVGELRAVRKEAPSGELITISAADPLNLTGVLTPDERVPAITSNRIVFRDGVAVAAYVARQLKLLPGARELSEVQVRAALAQQRANRSPAAPMAASR